LTPSARSGDLIAGDGTKNGLSAPNKELETNRKQQPADQLPSHGNSPLTGKAPYKSANVRFLAG